MSTTSCDVRFQLLTGSVSDPDPDPDSGGLLDPDPESGGLLDPDPDSESGSGGFKKGQLC